MAEVQVIKKQWYEIIAPKMFGGQVIGETYLPSLKSAIGKPVLANLGTLTGDLKKQNYYIKFLITTVGDGKAYAEITGYLMTPSSVRRMVRRGSEKIDSSFKAATADGKLLQIKIVMLTKNAVKKSILALLQKKAQEMLTSAAKKTEYNAFMQEVVVHKLQTTIRNALSKIYPLRIFEIRHIEVVREEKKAKEEVPVTAGTAAEIKEVKEEKIQEEKIEKKIGRGKKVEPHRKEEEAKTEEK